MGKTTTLSPGGRTRRYPSHGSPAAPLSLGPGLPWGRSMARPAPSDWLRLSGRRAAIGPRGCLARGRARWGGGGWKLLEVKGRGGRADGLGRGRRDAGARARSGAVGDAGARARGEGPVGHRPRPLPGSAPRCPDRGRPGGRRAGCIPILGVAGHSRRESSASGRGAAGGVPGRPWPPPAPRAPPCCSPSATPCSCPSTRYPRRPCWHRALAAPVRPCAIRSGPRTWARTGAGARP